MADRVWQFSMGTVHMALRFVSAGALILPVSIADGAKLLVAVTCREVTGPTRDGSCEQRLRSEPKRDVPACLRARLCRISALPSRDRKGNGDERHLLRTSIVR
jgi:hypothetical protein